MTKQYNIDLPHLPRGVHLITDHISPLVDGIEAGTINVFLKHTSASLALGENWESEVRRDIEIFLSHMIPDGWGGFTHTLEGEDDMSAHMKNTLIGSSLTIPITNSRLNLGTWQGIYLLEHRNHPSNRKIIATICH